MGYSDGMTNMTAPDLTPGYPSRGRTLGPAWQAMWDNLNGASRDKDPFLDGRALAMDVAPDFGLSADTLVALLSRAANAGLLDRETRPVVSTRGPRNRTFYRSRARG